MMATHEPSGSRYDRLRRIGIGTWSIIGVIGLVVVIALGAGALSGILLPLVVAVIIGALLEPVVAALVRWRVPKVLAATLGVILALAVIVGVIMIIAWGFVRQVPEMTKSLQAGWFDIVAWIRSLEIETAVLERIQQAISDFAPQASVGIIGALSTTLSSAASFAIGVFFALFFLFFVLRDGQLFPAWLARTTGMNRRAVDTVDTQVRTSLRGYFKGIAVTAVLTAPIFAIPLLLLGIPLIVPILILYFFLSFIPFLGAWITGVFAIVVAFGSEGPTAALIVGIALLISNGTIQSVVSSWALGSSLRMHPMTVLIATLIGGVVAGIIGLVLAAPLVAATRNSVQALRAPEDEPATPVEDKRPEPADEQQTSST